MLLRQPSLTVSCWPVLRGLVWSMLVCEHQEHRGGEMSTGDHGDHAREESCGVVGAVPSVPLGLQDGQSSHDRCRSVTCSVPRSVFCAWDTEDLWPPRPSRECELLVAPSSLENKIYLAFLARRMQGHSNKSVSSRGFWSRVVAGV